jgi:atypical dual specificity phosphatase
MSNIQNITNKIYAPIKVIYDKSYEYIYYYMTEYYKNDEKIEIDRLYKRISTYRQVISFFDQPTYILDNIWLGNARNAASFYDLKNKHIKLIINVTNEISNYYPSDFEYINYNINDNNKDEILEFLNDSYKKIIDFNKNNNKKNILIHCFMGASRSASILLFYIIKTLKNEDGSEYTLNQAIKFLKEKRNIINPSEKFMLDLQNAIYDLN